MMQAFDDQVAYNPYKKMRLTLREQPLMTPLPGTRHVPQLASLQAPPLMDFLNGNISTSRIMNPPGYGSPVLAASNPGKRKADSTTTALLEALLEQKAHQQRAPLQLSMLKQPQVDLQFPSTTRMFPLGAGSARLPSYLQQQQQQQVTMQSFLAPGAASLLNRFSPQLSNVRTAGNSLAASASPVLRAEPAIMPVTARPELKTLTKKSYVPMGIEEDPNWLSEFQCFVRAELLEVIQASERDVEVRSSPKNRIELHQVGIRCRFCANCNSREKSTRSSAFPSSIRQFYQSFTMMLRDHFESCPMIPKGHMKQYLALKNRGSQGACDSKDYWLHSAKKLGMIDSEDHGIIMTPESKALAAQMPSFRMDAAAKEDAFNPDSTLTRVGDATDAAPYLHGILGQVQLVKLLPLEKLGKRSKLPVGLSGLGCRYCHYTGRLGFSRCFPLNRKTLPARVEDIYDHLQRCPLCPDEAKTGLSFLRNGAPRPPKDQETAFFDMLWSRLGRDKESA